MPNTIREQNDTLVIRADKGLTTDVRRLAEQQQLTLSETARRLLRAGIETQEGSVRVTAPPLYSRQEAADRAVFLMEQLDGIAHGLGGTDPEGAAHLFRGVAAACQTSEQQWLAHAANVRG